MANKKNPAEKIFFKIKVKIAITESFHLRYAREKCDDLKKSYWTFKKSKNQKKSKKKKI